MQVAGRVDFRHGRGRGRPDHVRIDRLAIERCLRVWQAMRPVAGADDADVRVRRAAGGVLVIKSGNSGKRKVAAPEREFLEGPAAFCRPRRQPDLDDQFVGCEHGGKRAGEELRGRHGAPPRSAGENELCVAGHGDAGHFGGRIGVREAAARGTPVADLVMRNMAYRGLQERLGLA